MQRNAFLFVVLLGGVSGHLAAQATGTPSFNAPYRAFSRHEFGGTISFPRGGNVGVEGQYRFGYQRFDVGVRGGFVDAGATTLFVLGVEGRARVITHTDKFPADGALIVGVGGRFANNSSQTLLMGGLSLGRRIDPKDSPVSIVPYVEPVLYLASGGGTDVLLALGLGADFRLSSVLDARVSIGFGDVQGIAFSAVWVH
ncbi:MAG: hypothetical protein EXR93_06275 [Gemmatimonadetes bacterium]|nr:hypothetical protein [Gemmatimonadota bacterium]